MSVLTTQLAFLLLTPGLVQSDHGYSPVKPVVFDGEVKNVPDIWVMDFEYRSPRYIMVDIPGKGRKLIWYMTYAVTNRTGKPREFYPQFELVTKESKVYKDVILPKAEEKVVALEDPTNKLLNSVTISAEPIPVTPKESIDNRKWGVVFWEDVDMTTRSFDIWVSGLSNGYVRGTDAKTKKEQLKKKSLRLSFSKPGDDRFPDYKEIRYVSDSWDYR